jgi:hypothetical protein
MSSTPLRQVLAFAGLFAVAALAACGDARVRDLKLGMNRDSVMATLGSAPPDTDAYIFDRGQYIIDGKQIEVFYYDPKSRMAYVDSVNAEELTPVVLLAGKVTGWGWEHWDSVAASVNIKQPHKKAEP